jgi:predicted GNAT family N-acyltransferase
VTDVAVGVIDGTLSRELRRSVLRPETSPHDPLPGDGLEAAVHFGATVDRRVVSACFVFPDPCPWLPDRQPAWHLRQMATEPEMRGRGLAGQIVDATVDYVRAAGGAVLWLYGRELAVPMYARHGFVRTGDLFTDDRHTVPHMKMHRLLG